MAEKIGEMIEEMIEKRTMDILVARDLATGEAAMITADREAVHEDSARRLQAKGSLL